MSSVQDVACLAGLCNAGRRLPTRARLLTRTFSTLDEQDRRLVRLQMIKHDVPRSMALRACQVAPSSLKGSNRIIQSLIVIFGKDEAIAILHEVDYYRRLFACAERFAQPKKNRLNSAQQLCEHLAALFGPDPETSRLLAELQSKIGDSTASRAPQYAVLCT